MKRKFRAFSPPACRWPTSAALPGPRSALRDTRTTAVRQPAARARRTPARALTAGRTSRKRPAAYRETFLQCAKTVLISRVIFNRTKVAAIHPRAATLPDCVPHTTRRRSDKARRPPEPRCRRRRRRTACVVRQGCRTACVGQRVFFFCCRLFLSSLRSRSFCLPLYGSLGFTLRYRECAVILPLQPAYLVSLACFPHLRDGTITLLKIFI